MSVQRTVAVGLSGGVDSSVAAALLQREGWRVVGAFMKNWSDTKDPATGDCAWRKEREDALRVAAHLGIPFLTFDFEEEYRREVVEYMVREYAAGRTPNPDVMCNKAVKFGLFLERALAEGADAVATGHYARIGERDGRPTLLAGVDPNKDQSYFLHQMTREQLSRTIFPIGIYEKEEVRRMAAEFGLPTAEKKDSQGICFVGKVDLKNFLSVRVPARRGPIVTTDGRVAGVHRGMAPFTIGQRHGLALAGGPYFVVEKDATRNAVIIGRGDDPELMSRRLIAEDVHWIGQPPDAPFSCAARIRYRQPLQKATARSAADGAVTVEFDQPQRAVSPGQFIVFYEGDRCLGGAVIREAIR